MKENSIKKERSSIEEDIKVLEKKIEDYEPYKNIEYCSRAGKILQEEHKALEHLLSDYKRALKINKVLLKENEELKKLMTHKNWYTQKLEGDLFGNASNYVIKKQKIKDIIDRIDYDIKKTKEIISNNSNIYTSDRRNDYQIVRLKAMNTKSLDIKKRLQELLESEE